MIGSLHQTSFKLQSVKAFISVSPCLYVFKMFAVRVIFVVFLFANGFCQANGDLEACEKRVAQLETIIGGLKGPFGKYSLPFSL